MSYKHLLDHQDRILHFVAAPYDAFLSDLTPEEVLTYKCSRIHTFLYNEGQLNYVFPCIKEFNQHYYAIHYKS